ncbi:MAG: carbohydrate ABC transporter permease [Lachnospiraceae bacterium]|nr:carbohydrate ABC transporter permease [Lachnospiraceae bacterium]
MELECMRNRKNMDGLVLKRAAGKTGTLFFKVFRLLLLAGVGYLVIYPLITYLSIALSEPNDLYEELTGWMPQDPTFLNFKGLFGYFKYWDHLWITVSIAGVSTLLTLITCPLVGYGLARYRFKGNNIVFAMVILSIIVPIQTAQIPMYLDYQEFDFFGIGRLIGLFTGKPLTANLLNSYWVYYIPALFGVGLRSGLYIFLFRQYFMGMPRDLEDAGKVDGCSKFGVYLRIFVPNVKPVFVTEFLLSMIYYWNDTTYSRMFITLPDRQPLALYVETMDLFLNMMKDSIEAMEARTQLFAARLLVVLPLMILFIVCQKFFIESMDRSGIKG